MGLADSRIETIRQNMDRIASIYEAVLVQHEIGEQKETIFPSSVWQRMLAAHPHTPVELLVRALKDLLADTGRWGVLQQAVKRKDEALLGLYVAFGDGLVRVLFPELAKAFQAFVKDRNWGHIDDAIVAGHQSAADYARDIIARFREGEQKEDPDGARAVIEDGMRARGLI